MKYVAVRVVGEGPDFVCVLCVRGNVELEICRKDDIAGFLPIEIDNNLMLGHIHSAGHNRPLAFANHYPWDLLGKLLIVQGDGQIPDWGQIQTKPTRRRSSSEKIALVRSELFRIEPDYNRERCEVQLGCLTDGTIAFLCAIIFILPVQVKGIILELRVLQLKIRLSLDLVFRIAMEAIMH